MAKNKTIILITGGSSRLGTVMSTFLANKGYTIYATSRKTLTSERTNLIYLKMDVTSDREVERAVAEIIKKEKRIDIVINNAGVTLTGKTFSYSAEDFLQLLNINLVGSFRVAKAVMSLPTPPRLIIQITSLNGFLAVPDFALYCASKFGLEGLGQTLHYELSPSTQFVNVAPGALKAESAKKMPHKPAREKFPMLNWLLPLTTLEDVSKEVAYLFTKKTLPSRVLIGRDARVIYFLQKVLPSSLFDTLIMRISRKK